MKKDLYVKIVHSVTLVNKKIFSIGKIKIVVLLEIKIISFVANNARHGIQEYNSNISIVINVNNAFLEIKNNLFTANFAENVIWINLKKYSIAYIADNVRV